MMKTCSFYKSGLPTSAHLKRVKYPLPLISQEQKARSSSGTQVRAITVLHHSQFK